MFCPVSVGCLPEGEPQHVHAGGGQDLLRRISKVAGKTEGQVQVQVKAKFGQRFFEND